jgi:hypothetical protein
MAQMRSADRICVAENPLEASDRPYQAVRSKDWINLKSRKHPAMKLVVERSFTQMNGMLDLGQRREGPARKASNGSAVRRDAQVSVAFLSQRWRTLMLRRVLILSAAATMLLVTTFHSDDASPAAAAACAPEDSTAAAPCEREATAAARSQLGDTEAGLSLCAAGAWPEAIGAPTVQGPIAATVSARRQWEPRPWGPQPPVPRTMAATALTTTATMRMAIGSVRDSIPIDPRRAHLASTALRQRRSHSRM